MPDVVAMVFSLFPATKLVILKCVKLTYSDSWFCTKSY